MFPVRANPVCTSSAMNTTSFFLAQATSAGRKPSAGTMKPPSPWMGSMMMAARFATPICFSIMCDRLLGRLGAAQPAVAERIRHRRAVDLRGERAEAALVRHALGGERHGEVGATVVGVVEGDDGLLVGVAAGDLDRVLDGLRTTVEQRTALLEVTGRQPVERLGNLDIGVVRRDHEAGVGELIELGLHRLDHARGTVADR